jgi:hypothetical protein
MLYELDMILSANDIDAGYIKEGEISTWFKVSLTAAY